MIALFENGPEGYRPLANVPFARVIEDVRSPDSLWVKAARLYIRLLDAKGGRAGFEAERDRLRRALADPDSQAIAADIDAYLAAPSSQTPAP